MAQTWSMAGRYIKNCNCDPGCPCDFNQAPTHGNCEGMLGMGIDKGSFDGVSLDGLHWAALYWWPGRIDEGNGDIQWIVDEAANDEQRDALLTILGGKAGGIIFEILDMVCPHKKEPISAPFEFGWDIDQRSAHMKAGDVLDTATETLRGIDPPDPYRILVQIPGGFEYTGEGNNAEVAQAQRIRGQGDIKFDLTDAHSSLARVHFTGEQSIAA
jgi:hypothetical protein